MKSLYKFGVLFISLLTLFAFTKPGHKTPNILPIESSNLTKVSSGYGMRTHPITHTKKMHTGIDYVAPLGTPVLATADGKVTKIVHQDKGYGNQITITHSKNIKTIYSQLDETNVELGQKVSQKDVIGTVGNSGASTGPHLHYEIEVNSTKVDPATYIN